MHFYGVEDGIWAGWFGHKKPVFAKLVIDAEGVALKGKVDPGFGNPIADEISKGSATQLGNMISNHVPIFLCRQ